MWEDRERVIHMSVTPISLKGPITLEPPYNFSELYQSGIALAARHTHPTYDWWRLPSGEASLSLYNAGRLRVPVVESLDWTIVEVTLGPDSQRLVHGPCELKCCERTPEDKTYVIYLAVEESNGKAYVVGQREAGTRAEI